MFAATNGYMDDVPVEKVKDFEDAFHTFMADSKSSILDEIIEKKQLDDDLSKSLGEAIESFKKTVPY